MDYKKSVDVLYFHAIHHELNGIEWRTLVYLVKECHHKTNLIRVSIDQVAKAVHTTKTSVSKAIKTLISIKSVEVISPKNGKDSTQYIISTEEELMKLYGKRDENPGYNEWYCQKQSLFSGIEDQIEDLNEQRERCTYKDCSTTPCDTHKYVQDKLIDSVGYREREWWISKHPKPPTHIMVVATRGKIR